MKPLHIMTWNVRYFSHRLRGVRSTEGNLRAAAAAIGQLSPVPDIIALQEVEETSLRAGFSGAPQLDRFAQALRRHVPARRYQALYFPAHRYAVPLKTVKVPPLYTTGLALLVDDELTIGSRQATDITHVRLPVFAGLKQRRIVAHVRLHTPGGALDVFNTHLSLPAFFEGGLHTMVGRMGQASNQQREAEHLLAFIDQQRAAEGAAVVVGDLNSRPGSAVIQAFLAAGFDDPHAQRGQQVRGTARFAQLRMHIDHMFSAGVTWNQAETMAIDDPKSPFIGLSDHAPKLGTLTLRRSSASL